ncbi:MAG: cellulose 1,4-beta-cellobiosidase, partial [Gaiellaceae bacterium]|nr:cellulose 1,4-beta-cellobiosidase [Gaiellaceae bacterium]
QSVTQNGSSVTAAPSLAAFQAATGASWFYDGATTYVKAPAATGTDTTVITYGTTTGDTTAPTAPGTPSATSVGTTTATISWARSSDNVAVSRYDVSRNGTVVGSAPQPASGNPSFADSGPLTASTTYSYVVTAFDAAGNRAASPAGSVTTAAAPDATPPSKPVVAATPAATSVTLTWPRATDNVAVSRYDITRGPALVGTVPQPASGNVTFTESGLTPGTAYSYVVTAFDAAGNSTASDAVPVATTAGGGGGTFTLTATADAKVDASLPDTNYATVALRLDGSPDIRSYVKFNATTVTGTVQTATLRIWTTSAHTLGFDVYGVSDSTWNETGITYGNQPSSAISPTKLGSSGAATAGAWKEIDVKAQITGPGTYSFVLRTTSATALALASREDAAHAPQLVVTTT